MGYEFVKLTYDVRSFEKNFNDLPNVTKRAVASTLNIVGRQGNAKAKKFITTEYNIKASDLKIGKLVTLRTANVRRGRNAFTIFIEKKARGLLKYSAVQLAKGVRVKIKKSTKTIRSAFISIWRAGEDAKFVFVRDIRLGTYLKGQSEKAKRRQLFGPRISDIYDSIRVREIIGKTVSENFQKTLDEKFNQQFEKKR